MSLVRGLPTYLQIGVPLSALTFEIEAIWAASPTTTRGQPTPLSSDPKGERIAYAVCCQVNRELPRISVEAAGIFEGQFRPSEPSLPVLQYSPTPSTFLAPFSIWSNLKQSNKSIFLRSIDHPSLSTQYTDHTTLTTVARFSPSGFYVASGDISGIVRIWDATGSGTTKLETSVISGPINDIAWDGDSQRIIAVGNGKERMGHCFTWDSGNSVGEVSGHSSNINCVDVRKKRPMRAATGSDDTAVVWYEGPPFRFKNSLRNQHQRFVFGVQFSPDGELLASVGADKRVWLYDGKTGEPKAEIGQGKNSLILCILGEVAIQC